MLTTSGICPSHNNYFLQIQHYDKLLSLICIYKYNLFFDVYLP